MSIETPKNSRWWFCAAGIPLRIPASAIFPPVDRTPPPRQGTKHGNKQKKIGTMATFLGDQRNQNDPKGECGGDTAVGTRRPSWTPGKLGPETVPFGFGICFAASKPLLSSTKTEGSSKLWTPCGYRVKYSFVPVLHSWKLNQGNRTSDTPLVEIVPYPLCSCISGFGWNLKAEFQGSKSCSKSWPTVDPDPFTRRFLPPDSQQS